MNRVDAERKTSARKPCRTCGVGRHVRGACDMCGIAEDNDDKQYAQWLASKRRNRKRAELWR